MAHGVHCLGRLTLRWCLWARFFQARALRRAPFARPPRFGLCAGARRCLSSAACLASFPACARTLRLVCQAAWGWGEEETAAAKSPENTLFRIFGIEVALIPASPRVLPCVPSPHTQTIDRLSHALRTTRCLRNARTTSSCLPSRRTATTRQIRRCCPSTRPLPTPP